MNGRIEVILGPMFSGKSTELLRRIRRHTIANQKCFVIKYKNDTRYSDESMSTHDRCPSIPAPLLLNTWKSPLTVSIFL